MSESVVGAPVIRAYGAQQRTADRIDDAIAQTNKAQTKAQAIAATTFCSGELTTALANSAVIVTGVLLAVHGDLTAGRLIGFFFLVTLFVQPVQVATEVLNEAQNAIAGMRRVLGVLDTPTDVADPQPGLTLPAGAVAVTFEHVSFAYPGGPEVLHDVDLEIAPQTRVAIVGETGSGKTTFAKLLTRLMDPTRGRVLLSGLPLDEISFASLRQRVVMVPQDGFLFDSSVADNVRYGRPDATDDEIAAGLHRARSARLAGEPAARTRHATWGSAASRCRSASASSSRSPAPTSPTPTCWCSTRRRVPSIPPPRCDWPGRSTRSPAAGRP